MKTRQECFAVRASVAAVRVALLAMALAPAAYAADSGAPDPAVAALTNPTSTIEVGAGYVSQDSFKFGQYNGLFNKGVYGIFNIDARGGAQLRQRQRTTLAHLRAPISASTTAISTASSATRERTRSGDRTTNSAATTGRATRTRRRSRARGPTR